MRFCKDCRWMKPYDRKEFREDFSKCAHPKVLNPVSGEASSFCSGERTRTWLGAILTNECGRQGRRFEPKLITILGVGDFIHEES